MEQAHEALLRRARPRPTHSRGGAVTTLIHYTANCAAWMLPSRLRNWQVPALLPTTETIPLTDQMAAGLRQAPSTSSNSYDFKILKVLAWVLLGLLVTFVLVYRKATSLMKWAYGDELDESNKPLNTKPTEKVVRPRQSGKCVLPAYPENGSYVIHNGYGATPGKRFESVKLTVICLPEFRVLGNEEVFCVDGVWTPMPKCVRFCKLDHHTSVHYHCLLTGSVEGSRKCNTYEPSGTVVKPECNSPNYYSSDTLRFMRCIDGSWDYVAVCKPECGRVTPNGVDLMIDGKPAKRGEVPWHVGVYRKKTKPYMQICGGTIVSNRLVISAAHCFWNDVTKQQPASMYAVAAGKIYRPWNNPRDVNAQKSDVKEIKIPARFQGNAANFQDDIALLILTTAFVYHTFVRPVCLNFELKFDQLQLQPGKFGKVAGWGLTSENGVASQVLKVVDMPFVRIEECIAKSPPAFREYITSDKMCAGYGNGTALCKGDSGGGLAFPESERGTDRYYLRGVVSTAANNGNLCNSNTVAGWGLTSENGVASQVLKVVDMPFVRIEECIAKSPPAFREYITSDKMCAGYGNGTALCKGDSGGGLAFPESERGTDRYYLRGVVSTAANNGNLCNSNTVAGWGLTSENGVASQVLKVVDMPFVRIEECIAKSPPAFREYITSDKMCAGYGNGTALCKGDSGGGLAFPESERGTDRYYLRGVVSTAANNGNLCNSNTVAGWGLTSENGVASQVLKVVDMPFVRIEECIAKSPPAFREYITSDKMCAGYGNGTALCKGDSGGGLAFPESERGTDRYYLRGVVSTAANNGNLCNSNTVTTFTQILIHEHFVMEYL